jgi:release factor glutamine methyltransferase
MAALPEIDMAFDCDVYEPAEDTFLFVDALQDELPALAAMDPTLCVEIGCAIVEKDGWIELRGVN